MHRYLLSTYLLSFWSVTPPKWCCGLYQMIWYDMTRTDVPLFCRVKGAFMQIVFIWDFSHRCDHLFEGSMRNSLWDRTWFSRIIVLWVLQKYICLLTPSVVCRLLASEANSIPSIDLSSWTDQIHEDLLPVVQKALSSIICGTHYQWCDIIIKTAHPYAPELLLVLCAHYDARHIQSALCHPCTMPSCGNAMIRCSLHCHFTLNAMHDGVCFQLNYLCQNKTWFIEHNGNSVILWL